MGLAAMALYTNSVANRQPDAGALTGELEVVDDGFAVDMNESVTVDFATNDTGDVDITSYEVTEGPDHGTLGAIDPVDGSVEYTPDPDWAVSDGFTYAVDEVPGSLFDTASLSTGSTAAGGIVGWDQADPNWRISETLDGPSSAATGVPGWGRTWAANPWPNAEWICGAACATSRGDIAVFHRDFQLVDQQTADNLVLAFDIYADDILDDVWVNGVSTGISRTTPTYCTGCGFSFTLDAAAVGWVVGTNTISLQVRNTGAGPMGLLLSPSSGDEDGDGVKDVADRCLGTPDGVAVNELGCRTETGFVTLAVTAPTTTSTTVAPTTTSTTVAPPSTTAPEPGLGSPDTDSDGDGIPDWRDPTPIVDLAIEFISVDRAEVAAGDVITYRIRATNYGPAAADGTTISMTPTDGAVVDAWRFDSWEAFLTSESNSGGSLFAGGGTATPTCWRDATVLRCELGAVASGWTIEFDVETTVGESTSDLTAGSSITSLSHDINIDNNTDRFAVKSTPSLVTAIPEAVLAFTGIRYGLTWWVGGAVLLLGLGGGMMLLSARHRREDEPLI